MPTFPRLSPQQSVAWHRVSEAGMHHQKPTAIVLGGTVPHIALIQRLKERGYHTVLVDYLANPPAKAHADLHEQASTLDHDRVSAIAQAHDAALVLSTAVDQANAVACSVSEQLGLPVPYGAKTALQVTNKGLMKELMHTQGIPSAAYKRVSSVDAVAGLELSFPVVVKPIDTTGSKGVRLAANVEELVVFLRDALALSRTGEAIVEGYVEGCEIQVDFFVLRGVPHRLMVREKMPLMIGRQKVFQSVGSVVHDGFSPVAIHAVQTAAEKLAKALGLKNTPLFIQCILRDEQVQVVEFALRIGGGLSFSMIQRIMGFDIMSATLDALLGCEPAIDLEHDAMLFGTCLLYGKPCTFGAVQGLPQLKDTGKIEEYYLFKESGARIHPGFSSSERVAAFMVKAPNRKSLYQRAVYALDSLDIVDLDGRTSMRRDIYGSIET